MSDSTATTARSNRQPNRPHRSGRPDRHRIRSTTSRPVCGGLERHLIPSEAVSQEKAAVMKSVLTAGVPTIRLAFEDGRLRFADGMIEAGRRVYRGEFVDDVDSFVVFAPAQKDQDAASEKQ